MIQTVLIYPNKKLKEVSKEVSKFDSSLAILLDDMYETMMANNGIGLAAIQIGINKRVLIINIPREDNQQIKDDLIEIINPEIKSFSGESVYQEGCLSVPEFYADVKRFEIIQLEYFDRDGEKQNLKADGLLSIAIQHEMDHLDGKIFVEKLSMMKRKKFEKEWKKVLKEKR